MSQSQQDCLITVMWLKKKNYKNSFFRVVFSGLVCVHLSPTNFFMALFLNQNLWGPVRNEYLRPLVQELLRISKRQQQSQTPSSCTCHHAMVWWQECDQPAPAGSRLQHLVPVIRGGPETHFPHLKHEADQSHLSHRCQAYFLKSQTSIPLSNTFFISLWGREHCVFRLGMNGREGIWWMKCGSFTDERRGPERGCSPSRAQPDTLRLAVFLLACILSPSVARVMKPVADLTARQLGHCPVGLVVMLRS